MHLLDRPVWGSLATYHESTSFGTPSGLARRYARGVNVFGSSRDESTAAVEALGDLVLAGELVYVLQVSDIQIPSGCLAVKQARGVQMVASSDLLSAVCLDGIQMLGDGDAPEMLALALLTEPGPFLERTHTMGRFYGVRIDGRLVAMAGERMRLPGYAEVSGVCTHPDYRGRGLARKLSAAVANGIRLRGECPFLHAWRGNAAAIALYEGLGFEIRSEVNVAILERRGN